MTLPGEPRVGTREDGHSALRLHSAPPSPRGAVLLLHGGRADALTPPPLLNLPAARMRAFRGAIRRATRDDQALLASVSYRHRGWNGSREDPVRDVREALDELTRLAPLNPVVLVGHSMGARAALRAAEHPQVNGVVALAPWCPPGSPVAQLRDKHVIVLHDNQDRVTDARESWDFLRRARRAGAHACGIAMPRGGHAMLRDAGAWHRLAASLTAGVLGTRPLPPAVVAAQRSADGAVLSAESVLAELSRP
ncbi:alpha/beta fold hydrolase [Streptomyces sp. H27-C3]|uniref:alpha/beta hydrolase n=1 Tax=Streptomyces sp. H27-C3 TaxID=3046305 RepID=UPI0024BAF7C9|nr:alpha/beta fold hydrolase [Streptomyces sp. H27-C3]MDJ0460257.1 alpha/beta fold hydrolase [Streptomyces sp. H27-C3]